MPPQFMSKSLSGNQAQLMKWVCPAFGLKPDRRNLHGLALDGLVWIVKSPDRRLCLVYFRTQDQHRYAEANQNRLDLERKQQRT
jgi:hypothetical protein